MDRNYIDYAVEQIGALCAIPSPTGFTDKAAEYIMRGLADMGYAPERMRKGGVLCHIGGEGNPLILAAHADTLGAMVRSIKPNGRLRPTTIGGFRWDTADGENCTVHTRDGREYGGVILNAMPSVHVSGVDNIKRSEEFMEILLDDSPADEAGVKALGIRPGDFISADARFITTPSGTIKSRFLDDKASCGILLALARFLSDGAGKATRSVYLLFTVYEEVGHGGSAGLPRDAEEIISVDMGAVGDDLGCDERKVSICAKDSGGPYNYAVTSALIDTAEKLKLNYAIDVYPRYGSDAEVALHAGYDLKHGLIGPGIYSSHNYERGHRDGIENTLRLLAGYIAL